jgi:hypothetical protein
MTTRDILQSNIAELVPAAENTAWKLPVRDIMPKNTVSLGTAAADAFGIKLFSDDPEEIERLIDRTRDK